MNSKGITVVDVVIGVGIGSLLLGAVVLFVGRGFGVGRENFEQARITDNARFQIRRMENAIRNSRDLDLNQDGTITIPGDQLWLFKAAQYEMSFFSNIDGDSDIERVRYFIEAGDTNLKRGITNPSALHVYNLAAEDVQIIVSSIRNRTDSEALFSYFGGIGGVERVRINMKIDVNTAAYPDAAYVRTEVTPRRIYSPSSPSLSTTPTSPTGAATPATPTAPTAPTSPSGATTPTGPSTPTSPTGATSPVGSPTFPATPATP